MAERTPREIETAPAPPAAAAGPGRAKLLILRGDDVRAIPIPAGGVISVGRSDRADVQIDDASLSRVHFTVELAANGDARVRDEGSSNGTLVRGARIASKSSVPIAPGEFFDAGGIRVAVV